MPESKDSPGNRQRVAIPTSQWRSRSGKYRFLARLSGKLMGGWIDIDTYSVWIASGFSATPVIWPADFSARLDPLELLGADGTVVARAGNTVSVTGGMKKVDPGDPRMLGKRQAFLVQSEVKVL